jgi:DNA-binding CsgD family transcriptional regulator
MAQDGLDPYVRLNCSANLALIQGQVNRTADSPLLDIAKQAEDALLLFVANKAKIFQARLLCGVGALDAANELLAQCVPAQLQLGHLNLLSQEMVLDPVMLTTYLTGGPSPSERDGLLYLVAKHWRGSESLAALAGGAGPALVDAVLDAVASLGQEDLMVTVLRAAGGNPDKGVRASLRRRLDASGPARLDDRLAQASLTRREIEVLRLMSKGLRNAEIVDRLHLSPSTVKTHINHIFAKLEVEDRVAAILEYQASRES